MSGSLQPRRRFVPEPSHAGTLILDFQQSELWEIYFCCDKQPSLWYFAIGDKTASNLRSRLGSRRWLGPQPLSVNSRHQKTQKRRKSIPKKLLLFSNIPGESRKHSLTFNGPLRAEREAVFVLVSLWLPMKLHRTVFRKTSGEDLGSADVPAIDGHSVRVSRGVFMK